MLLSRSLAKMEVTRGRIISAAATAKIILIEMDLKSYESVERAAESLSKKIAKIDVLILNAGAIGIPLELIQGRICKY